MTAKVTPVRPTPREALQQAGVSDAEIDELDAVVADLKAARLHVEELQRSRDEVVTRLLDRKVQRVVIADYLGMSTRAVTLAKLRVKQAS